jgi:hypothetical protein
MAGWNRIRELLDEPLATDPRRSLHTHEGNGIELRNVVYNHDGTREVLRGVTPPYPRAVPSRSSARREPARPRCCI